MQKRAGKVMLAMLCCLVLAGNAAMAGRDMVVNGHVFSRLAVRQSGTTVTVSGGVQGGPEKFPLRAHIYVQNNVGQTVEAVVLVEAYTGGPETFEESFEVYGPARKWRVVAVRTN